MDLTEYNFYMIKFTNGSEKILRTELYKNTKKLIDAFEDSFRSSKFIELKQVNIQRDRHPVYHAKNTIFSIEKINTGMIGNTSQLWEINE